MSRFRTDNAARSFQWAEKAKPLAGRMSASLFILLIIILVCSWTPAAMAGDGAAAGGYGDLSTQLPQASTAAGVSEEAAPADTPPAGSDDTTAPGATDVTDPLTPAPPTPEKSTTPVPPATGSAASPQLFTVIEEPPAAAAASEYKLVLECNYGDPGVFWESRADYDNGLLSINYRLSNEGPGPAHNVTITEATATQGVVLWSPMPSLGDIEAGGSVIFTLKWSVPPSVTHFETKLTACASCDEYEEIIDDEEEDPSDPGDDISPSSQDPVFSPPTRTTLPATGFELDLLLLVAVPLMGACGIVTCLRRKPAPAPTDDQ